MTLAFEARHTEGLSRLGTLETPHGTVETPALMPVINPNRRLIEPSGMAERFGVQMVITNSYIIKQGEELTEAALDRGVHELIGFPGPIMTDSGTFQDYVYGDVGLEPAEIVTFQREIGTDIGTILDVFSTPDRTETQAVADAHETLVRAMDTEPLAGEMGLALPVQGATFPEVRAQAARDLARLNPPGGAIHPIGGVVPIMEDQRYATLARVILGAKRGLHPGRAVHLFGAGHPQMLPLAVYLGCDLFDSAAYAKFAHGDRLLFPWGTEQLEEMSELPCACPTCRAWTVAELQDASKQARVEALASHNLHATMAEMRRVREAQRRGRLFELVVERAGAHLALWEAVQVLGEHVEQLEAEEPLSHDRGMAVTPPWHTLHPQRARTLERIERSTRPRGPVVLMPPTRRPFTQNEPEGVEALRICGAHPFFPTRLGPVPYDLDEGFPFTQSLEAALTDEDLGDQQVRLETWADRWGVDVLSPEAVRKLEPEPTAPDLLMERVQATAAYQFGPQAADALLEGDVELETSKRTGRVRTVHADGEHVLSLRAHDGLFTLKLAGAQRIHAWLPRPALRLQVTEDSAGFNAQGKSVFTKFVLNCHKSLRPGDECLIVDSDDTLVACGQLLVSQGEALHMTSGMAAKVREGIGEDAYAPGRSS